MPVSPMSAQPFSSRRHFLANHAESMPAAVSSCPASRTTRTHIPGILKQNRKKMYLAKNNFTQHCETAYPKRLHKQICSSSTGPGLCPRSAHALVPAGPNPEKTETRDEHQPIEHPPVLAELGTAFARESKNTPKYKTTHLVVRLADELTSISR